MADDGSPFYPSGVTPVEGSFTATGQSSVMIPLAGRMSNVTISGTFVGSVQLERSFDGSSWFPLTAAGMQLYVWSAPGSESFEDDESGVRYRLNCISYTSGTINYRVSQ